MVELSPIKYLTIKDIKEIKDSIKYLKEIYETSSFDELIYFLMLYVLVKFLKDAKQSLPLHDQGRSPG